MTGPEATEATEASEAVVTGRPWVLVAQRRAGRSSVTTMAIPAVRDAS